MIVLLYAGGGDYSLKSCGDSAIEFTDYFLDYEVHGFIYFLDRFSSGARHLGRRR